jgi:hypothetical protein
VCVVYAKNVFSKGKMFIYKTITFRGKKENEKETPDKEKKRYHAQSKKKRNERLYTRQQRTKQNREQRKKNSERSRENLITKAMSVGMIVQRSEREIFFFFFIPFNFHSTSSS